MGKDNAKIGDEVKTEVSPSTTVGKFVRVEVTADAGIFKNGQQHEKGSEAVIEAGAAQRFEAVGDVKILGDTE